jgi:hypothetical protein
MKSQKMKSQKMKLKNNISKLLGALIIIFALTFSTNANAIASGQNIANSISLVITSANIATVTGDFQKKKKKKKKKCRKCGRRKHRGSCKGGGNNGGGNNGGGDSIPLDGGLSILLLGAAAFGVKKLRDTKK